MSKYLSIFLMLVFLVTASGANILANPAPICNSQTTATSKLFCLIYQRELLMKNVAAYKYVQQQSSYAPQQELKVLLKAGVEAKSNGLPVTDVQLYSQILMDISKQIQEYWFTYWREHKQTPVAPPSLAQIRQQIQEIDKNIIVSFVQIRDNDPIGFKQELENGIKKSLTQLDAISPPDVKELFINMLVKVIWSITKPIEEPAITPFDLPKVKGWSRWQPYPSFPHQRLQLGMSNMDYGGLMELEYACFGSVGEENKEKKSQSYWDRIAERVERIGYEDYTSIEVGCWMDGQFQATVLVTGIVLK